MVFIVGRKFIEYILNYYYTTGSGVNSKAEPQTMVLLSVTEPLPQSDVQGITVKLSMFNT